ncbi:hypothetical protein DH2020_043952 [Rehmannia glutinosa]|uniref:FAS1 domain-containing protein n=1 Tax=Rehmannia glutinosa TaxID=99300 RepID=A0ABR0UJ06_REHGL
MASLKLLSLLILTISVISAVSQPPLQAPPPPPQSLVNAADTLASSGYTAMSLTLQLIAPTLPLPSATITTLTIFSPPDAAFASSGQPSLAHLLLHFSPLSLSPTSLLSLPFSSTIPSLSPSKHLFVTSTQANQISINNVGISESPIFDDGFVIVYAIDNFFDLNFIIGISRSWGLSEDVMKWTVFAPVDEELVRFSGDFLRYFSLFMRHLAPCRVEWSDLEEMANGTVVSNNVNGFSLEITKDEDNEILMVNGVEITFPDMYESEWLVIHGIRGVIALPESSPEEEMDLMEERRRVSSASDRGEF